MPNIILVTFTSCTGSTHGMAEEIGKILRGGNTIVNVLSMQDIEVLIPYRAVEFRNP